MASSVGTDREDTVIKFETVGTVFAFDTHFLGVHEPACTIYVIDMVTGHQAPYTIC